MKICVFSSSLWWLKLLVSVFDVRVNSMIGSVFEVCISVISVVLLVSCVIIYVVFIVCISLLKFEISVVDYKSWKLRWWNGVNVFLCVVVGMGFLLRFQVKFRQVFWQG